MGKKVVHIEFPAKDADRAQKFWETVRRLVDRGLGDARHRLPDVPGGDGWGGAVFPEMEGASGTTIYAGSDDIEADLAKVRELGGKADDKQPIPGIGWFARCKDSEGNSFSLFQSDESVTMPEGAPGA